MRYRHAVFSQRARLVGTQHRRRTEGFYCRRAPGKHANLSDPPSAHCKEDRQYDRKLLGQHRHADSDARQYGLDPAAAQQPKQQHYRHCNRTASDRAPSHNSGSFAAQARCFGFERGERLADPTDLGTRPCRQHPGNALAARY